MQAGGVGLCVNDEAVVAAVGMNTQKSRSVFFAATALGLCVSSYVKIFNPHKD